MCPFDADKLDDLMEQARVDLVLASTRHNVRYLTGGYYFHFQARATRIGLTQYLPFVGWPRGRPTEAFYVGRKEEQGEIEARRLWIPSRHQADRGTVAAALAAVQAVKRLALDRSTIGLELPFLPADAYAAFQRELPGATLVDATPILTELRAVKSPQEVALLRSVYDRVAEAILAAFAAGRPGITTEGIAEVVRQEMERRGVAFLWAFTCAGPGFLRAPSQQAWDRGRVLHIDAGGEVNDYLADICRMGCLREPGPLAKDLHRACLEVQGRVRGILRAGLPCSAVHREGEEAVRRTAFAQYGRFTAHGIGMVSHEEPMVTPTNDRPLEAGMVLSIETEFLHPEVGHVKIEDAVAVTEAGCEGLGDLGREWQVVRA